jgi:predicted transcriptional regulator
LSYARRGKPVFPTRHHDDPEPTRRKSPLTRNGLKDASTDASRVHAFWNAHPGASIGVVAGEESGWWVLDVDRLEALGELPAELPVTLTVRTPSGGLHLYFRHDPRIVGNGRGRLPKGIDVRGGGRGYSLIPPSPGYVWEVRAEIVSAPEWLIELIVGPKDPQPPRRNDAQPTLLDLEGPTIIEGGRHTTLTSVAARLQDGSRSAADLLRDLHAINNARCSPPLEVEEVTRIAEWASGQEPCSPGRRSPEHVSAIESLARTWFAYPWKGVGGQSARDVYRVLIERAAKSGWLQSDGSIDVTAGVRAVAVEANVNYVTVSRSATRRLVEAGLVEKIGDGRDGLPATWRLLAQGAQTANTKPLDPPPLAPCAHLPTESPTWRFRGLVGKGAGHVESLLELAGPATAEELAETLGGRARDLRNRHLARLVAGGLVEERSDGRFALVADHREKVAEVKATAYAVLLRKSRVEIDPATLETAYHPEVYGRSLSEDERTEEDRQQHAEQREDYRALRLVVDRTEDETVAFEELEPAPPEMIGETRVGRVLLARGWKRFGGETRSERRMWVNPETGQAVPPDEAVSQAFEAA